jgi:hypothetical protein
MRTYLVSTCVIFGLVAVLHLIRAIVEWPMISSDPVHFLLIVGFGVVAGVLSYWSWRLLRRPNVN